jgi:hypothetical protein
VRRLLPLALLAAACIDDLEPPQYRVTDLRLLAVRAEVEGSAWADALPGDTLRLEALVANPLGRAPLSVTWYACLVPACDDEQILRDPAAEPGVLPLGEGACTPAAAGATCALSFAIPAPSASGTWQERAVAAAISNMLVLATAQPTFQCLFYTEIPVFAVAEAEGLREVAVKRVRLTPDPATLDDPALAVDYVRNSNPAIRGLYGGPSEDSCRASPALSAASFPPARTFLCGGVEAGAGAQLYNTTCNSAGVPTDEDDESLSWQWYATGGEFPEVSGVGNATDSAPEFERPAEAFTLWVILRDGRGGADWSFLAVDALAP